MCRRRRSVVAVVVVVVASGGRSCRSQQYSLFTCARSVAVVLSKVGRAQTQVDKKSATKIEKYRQLSSGHPAGRRRKGTERHGTRGGWAQTRDWNGEEVKRKGKGREERRRSEGGCGGREVCGMYGGPFVCWFPTGLWASGESSLGRYLPEVPSSTQGCVL